MNGIAMGLPTGEGASSAAAAAALRAPVGFRTSFVQQVRLLAWSGRVAILLAGVLFVFILVGVGESDFGPLARVHVAAIFSLPAAAMWGLAVWQGEVPHRRSWHWSLPVPRPAHDLARVAAGTLFLVLAWIVLAAAGAVLAATRGEWELFRASVPAWTTFFVGPLVLYFLVTPLILWSDSPSVRRGLLGFVVVAGGGTLLQLRGFLEFMELVFGSGWGFASAVLGGFLWQGEVESATGIREGALWLGMCLLATIAAAVFRPAQVARLFRRR